MTEGATGQLVIELDHQVEGGKARLHFCTELIAVVLRKTMPNQTPSIDEFQQFVRGLFDSITTGWQHAVEAVSVVIADYLIDRFKKA